VKGLGTGLLAILVSYDFLADNPGSLYPERCTVRL
jgi:hypothetical protein